MITLYFDDLQEIRNCFDETEIYDSGMPRITTSPYANELKHLMVYYQSITRIDSTMVFDDVIYDINLTDDLQSIKGKYIVPIGVNQSTNEWIGGELAENKTCKSFINIFDKISHELLYDLRIGKAFLMIDNSLEGYHDDSVFDFLTHNANARDISPNQIIYVTGNLNIENRLKLWTLKNPRKESIHVIPYSHFEFDIGNKKRIMLENGDSTLLNFKQYYEYKKENIDDIKLYNYLNKKPRNHRIFFYDALIQWDLLNSGLVSMNKANEQEDILLDYNIKTKQELEVLNRNLPTYAYDISNEVEPFSHYMYNFSVKETLNSWISVVSETHFGDNQKTIFLSEKTFKAIANEQPFVILGNKGSLKELHNYGYKTFHPLIDETYDELGTIDRLNAIIRLLLDFSNRDNKLEWLHWLGPILKHNSHTLMFNTLFKPPKSFHMINDLLNS